MAERGGVFRGVSVGPGDPELITLRALRVLDESDVIAAPDTGAGEGTALGIVADRIGEKPVLDCAVPMSRDRAAALAAYREHADRICAVLKRGKSVAFVAIGDVTVYSTFFYLQKLVSGRGYPVEVVPGVTSFCASAARLGIPLCEGDEELHVIPVGGGDAKTALSLPGTKVFMKAGTALPAFTEELRRLGLADSASLVANCGMEGERVYRRLEDAPGDLDDYFALVIVRG